MRRTALLALALVLVVAHGAAAAEPAPGAACAEALGEMRPAGARWRIGVSAGPGAAAVAAQIVARLPHDAVTEVVRLAPGATFATVQQGGFDLWIDVGARTVRMQRTSLAWRDWLRLPLGAWVRHVAVTAAPAAPRVFARPKRLDLDLGAPLLALAAVDVDGDGRAELVALTTDEVVLLAVKKGALQARQRVALHGAAPVPRPREPIGAIAAAELGAEGGPVILATSSEHVDGLRLGWRDGALVEVGALRAFPVCARPERTLALVPGRNVFTGDVVAAACAGEVAVDGRLVLAEGRATVPGVGAAFALADLDGDGAAEVVASAYRAPGDGDQLSIIGLADPRRPATLWKSEALSGGIVAVTVGDTDADGVPDVIFAARLLGANRTDVWIVR